MLPVNWMRFSKNKNRPSTSRKKAGSSTIQVRDDPLRKNGEKKSRNLTISGLFPHFCHPIGGDKRDRTADLLNAIQALSRLDDYTPTFPQADRLYPHCILEILQPYQAAPIRLTKNCSMLILNLILS